MQVRSTALHLAAGGGHTAVVQALVRAGVSLSPPWQHETLHSLNPTLTLFPNSNPQPANPKTRNHPSVLTVNARACRRVAGPAQRSLCLGAAPSRRQVASGGGTRLARRRRRPLPPRCSGLHRRRPRLRQRHPRRLPLMHAAWRCHRLGDVGWRCPGDATASMCTWSAVCGAADMVRYQRCADTEPLLLLRESVVPVSAPRAAGSGGQAGDWRRGEAARRSGGHRGARHAGACRRNVAVCGPAPC